MKKKDAKNPKQKKVKPQKKGIRLSTIVELFMFVTGILLTAMFFLPVYKEPVVYDSDYFCVDNLFNFFPEGSASYLGLAGRFLDNRNIAVTIMIFAIMLVMPILLLILTFPKLRKMSAFSIFPIALLVGGQFFLGVGFTVEQVFTKSVLINVAFEGLQFAPFGYIYNILVFQLPALYILFIIQSLIESRRMKKEAKVVAAGINNQSFDMGQNAAYNQSIAQETNGQFASNQQLGAQTSFGQVPAYNNQNNFYYGAPENGPQTPEENAYLRDDEENAASVARSDALDAADDNAAANTQGNAQDTQPSFSSSEDNALSGVSSDDENTTQNDDSMVMGTSTDNKENASSSAFDSDNANKEPVKIQPAFCQQCGAKLEEGALFCMQCGTPVN